MSELVEQLGNKVAGQLIRPEEWNTLVATVENIQTTLTERIDSVETTLTQRVDSIDATLTQLQSDFNAFAAKINPLLGQYYRVTMETTKINYAIGERAEIVARVTDLLGNPLDLTNEADRPWIDFVATWGQLKPIGGVADSDFRGGVGDRTLSVRTDTQGVARALLRSEFAEGFTDEAEDEVAAALTTNIRTEPNQPQASETIAEIILRSNTPIEAKNAGAFQTLTAEYDRADAVSVRSYVDAHYSRNTALITGKLTPTFIHRWRDYRSTVMAFATSDSDPRTPDQSRGVSSIQVTFRDWIGPWLSLDYFEETRPLVLNFRDRLTPKITGELGQSVLNVKSEVDEFVRDKGLVGKLRNYQVVHNALDEVTLPQPPVFLNTLARSIQDAVSIQQTLESVQAISAPNQTAAFEVFTNAAVQADTSTLQQQIGEALQRFDDINGQVSNLGNAVSSLNGRLDASLAEGGTLQQLTSKIEMVRQQVEVLQNFDVIDVQNKLSEVRVINDNLIQAKADITLLKDRIGSIG